MRAAVEDGEKPDPNARVLERRKANYASRNDEIRLRWRNGVIGPEPSECAPGATAFGKLEAADLFLNLVRQFEDQGRPLSVNPRSGNYAPRMFGKLPAGKRCEYREADFRVAMERLFAERQDRKCRLTVARATSGGRSSSQGRPRLLILRMRNAQISECGGSAAVQARANRRMAYPIEPTAQFVACGGSAAVRLRRLRRFSETRRK